MQRLGAQCRTIERHGSTEMDRMQLEAREYA
jgi:hypothetical protein